MRCPRHSLLWTTARRTAVSSANRTTPRGTPFASFFPIVIGRTTHACSLGRSSFCCLASLIDAGWWCFVCNVSVAILVRRACCQGFSTRATIVLCCAPCGLFRSMCVSLRHVHCHRRPHLISLPSFGFWFSRRGQPPHVFDHFSHGPNGAASCEPCACFVTHPLGRRNIYSLCRRRVVSSLSLYSS